MTDKLIILRNNAPKAVLLSIEAYDAIMEEIEDLRLGALGLARLKTFRPGKALSHKKMLTKFSKSTGRSFIIPRSMTTCKVSVQQLPGELSG